MRTKTGGAKRMLSLLLTLVMLVGLMPTAFAAETEEPLAVTAESTAAYMQETPEAAAETAQPSQENFLSEEADAILSEEDESTETIPSLSEDTQPTAEADGGLLENQVPAANDAETVDIEEDADTFIMTAEGAETYTPQQLKDLLDEIKAMDSTKYTSESWKALSDVVSELGSQDPLAAGQATVNYYVPKLTELKNALAPVADEPEQPMYQKLNALVDEVCALNPDDYTRVSKGDIFTVAAYWKEHPATADTNESTVTSVFNSLSRKKAGLVERTPQSDLTELIEDIDALAEGDYTAETWTPLMEAKNAITNPAGLSDEQAKSKQAELQDLKDALVLNTKKQKLENLINETKKLTAANYTAASWAAVQTILDTDLETVGEENAEALFKSLESAVVALRESLTLEDGTYCASITTKNSSILNRAKIVAKDGKYQITLYTAPTSNRVLNPYPSNQYRSVRNRNEFVYPLVEVADPRYNAAFPKGSEGYALKNLVSDYDLAASGYGDSVKNVVSEANNDKFFDSIYTDLGGGVISVAFTTDDLGDEFMVNGLYSYPTYSADDTARWSYSASGGTFTFSPSGIIKLPDSIDALNGKSYVKVEEGSAKNEAQRNISRYPGVELNVQGGKVSATFSLDLAAYVNYFTNAQSAEVYDAEGNSLDVSDRTVTFVYDSYDELIAGKYVDIYSTIVDMGAGTADEPGRGTYIAHSEFLFAVDFSAEPVTLTDAATGAKLYSSTKFLSPNAKLTATPITGEETGELAQRLWKIAQENIPRHGKECFFTLSVTDNGKAVTEFGGAVAVEMPKVVGLNDSAIRLFVTGYDARYDYTPFGWQNDTIVAHDDCYALLLPQSYFGYNWYIYDEKMSDKTGADLADGVFTVPITTFNQAQPSQTSMSAKCLGESATLVKNGDTLYIEMNFLPVDIGTMNGYLIQMWSDEKGTWEEIVYTSYYKSQDGALFTDSLNEDTLNFYPKTAYMLLPTTDVQFLTKFRVSAMDDIMSGGGDATRDAWFTIYYDDAVKISDSPTAAPIRQAIAAELDVAAAAVEADYTITSWTALQTAVQNAKTAKDNEASTQQELTAAHAGLRVAIDGLVLQHGDTTALQELIAKAEGYKAEDYTAVTYSALIEALNAAKTLVSTGGDQAQIDAAVTRLQTAINNLKSNVSAGISGGETLKSGNYYVEIALWHATADKESMGNVAFKNNNRALVTVSNGKITTVQVATNPVDVSGYHSAITTFKVDGKTATTVEKKDLTTTAGNQYQYISLCRFTMPSSGQPDGSDHTYLNVEFYVPDTPMDEVVGDTLNARLKFYWNTMTETDDASLESDASSARGTSSLTGKEITDVVLTDKETGIKVATDTERLEDSAELRVTKLTSGSDYDKAAKAMENEKDAWTLYEIVTLVNDKITAPEGSVTVSIPCTEAGLSVYRINDSGTRSTIKGEVKDGYYVFNTSSLGLFAIVGELGDAPKVSASGFTDTVGHWAEESINFVVEKGLFAGTGETTFSPDMSMTRGMFVTVLGRLAGVELTDGVTKFIDVKADAYYAPYVKWANENGIVGGTSDTTYSPDREIARQEMAVMLARYCEYAHIELKGSNGIEFADAGEIADWAKDSVDIVVKAGLLKGVGDNRFSPTSDASRAQVATLLARFIKEYDL